MVLPSKKRMIFNFYNLNQSGIWFTPVASNPAFAIVLHAVVLITVTVTL
jgi:hypothetical protein